ncbi:hypothetical protein, partial [Halalkalibacterium halodurans]|uniref:hypothetical protein n=1 Tax=Halalkalibacterium halodurans TaxID=86665 RepID=UPI001ABA2B08
IFVTFTPFNPGKSMVKFIVHAAPILSLFLDNSRIMDKGACVHFFCPLLCKNPNIYCRAFIFPKRAKTRADRTRFQDAGQRT